MHSQTDTQCYCRNLNILTFALWVLRSMVQSLLLMGVLVKTYGPDYVAPDGMFLLSLSFLLLSHSPPPFHFIASLTSCTGTGNTYDITQVAAYTAIIIIQCVTMALETQCVFFKTAPLRSHAYILIHIPRSFFTVLNHVAIWGTLAAYFIITAVCVFLSLSVLIISSPPFAVTKQSIAMTSERCYFLIHSLSELLPQLRHLLLVSVSFAHPHSLVYAATRSSFRPPGTTTTSLHTRSVRLSSGLSLAYEACSLSLSSLDQSSMGCLLLMSSLLSPLLLTYPSLAARGDDDGPRVHHQVPQERVLARALRQRS